MLNDIRGNMMEMFNEKIMLWRFGASVRCPFMLSTFGFYIMLCVYFISVFLFCDYAKEFINSLVKHTRKVILDLLYLRNGILTFSFRLSYLGLYNHIHEESVAEEITECQKPLICTDE